MLLQINLLNFIVLLLISINIYIELKFKMILKIFSNFMKPVRPLESSEDDVISTGLPNLPSRIFSDSYRSRDGPSSTQLHASIFILPIDLCRFICCTKHDVKFSLSCAM